MIVLETNIVLVEAQMYFAFREHYSWCSFATYMFTSWSMWCINVFTVHGQCSNSSKRRKFSGVLPTADLLTWGSLFSKLDVDGRPLFFVFSMSMREFANSSWNANNCYMEFFMFHKGTNTSNLNKMEDHSQSPFFWFYEQQLVKEINSSYSKVIVLDYHGLTNVDMFFLIFVKSSHFL